MNKKNIHKTTAVLIICTIIVKFFGALRDLVLGYAYGSSYISDAYILATTIPVTIFTFIYEGIAASFIPAMASVEDKASQDKLTSNLINCLIVFSAIIVLLIEAFPRIAIVIFASGFKDEVLQTAVYFIRISILGVFFTATAYVLAYYLNFNDSFIGPILRSIPMDIVVVVSILMSAYTQNNMFMAIGIPISLAIEMVFLIPQARKKGFHYRTLINLNDPGIRNIIIWSIPIIISSAIGDINAIVDRQFSSWLGEGSISVLTYSNRTLNMLRTTFFVPIITVLFPSLSRDIKAGQMERSRQRINESFNTMAIIGIPLTFGLILTSYDLVKILFERGAFLTETTAITGKCLKYYGIALFFYAMIVVSSRVFYAMTDMKTPLYISAVGLILNIISNFVLSRLLGIGGLAIATSVSTIFIAVTQYIVLKKRIDLDINSFVVVIIKSAISSIVMFLLLVYLRKMFSGQLPTLLLFVATAFIGCGVYCALMYMFDVKEVRNIFSYLSNKRR